MGLGSNLAFRALAGPDLLHAALAALGQVEGLAIVSRSGCWTSPAWPPGSDQPPYFNAVAELDCPHLDPQGLYAILTRIEAAFGRVRAERWGPRTLDLDIVDFQGLAGRFGDLILPHPHAHARAFVLKPLAEIAPDWRLPPGGAPIGDLVTRLDAADASALAEPWRPAM